MSLDDNKSCRETASNNNPLVDWLGIVEQELAGLPIPVRRKREICRELAGHLDEEFSSLCALEGELIARERVLRMVAGETEQLRREIFGAEMEDEVNHRTRAMWVPGLTSLIVSGFLLMAIGARQSAQLVVLQQGLMPMVLYPWWLASLPFVGALGAWLARRKGATPAQRLSAGLFPLLTMAVAFFVILPVAMVVDGIRIGPSLILKGFILATINWILIPGLPLLAGSLPFLRNTKSPRAAN